MMNRLLLIGMVCASTGLSCLWGDYNEEEECYEAPLWCRSVKPGYGTVKVRISTEFGPCDVRLFYGKVECGTPAGVYTQTDEEAEYSMPFEYISASVTYAVNVNGKSITVTSYDGDELECSEREYCDGVICYDPKDLTLDVRLDKSLLEEIGK